MFNKVTVAPKQLDEYLPVVGKEKIEEIRRLAEPLRGARVLNLNATAFGGGVAEILNTTVPLMNDLGLQAEWQVMRGSDEFFQVTKAMHNSLQGQYVPWTSEMRDIWARYNDMNALQFDQDFDFVVVHDPQPAGLLCMHADHLGHHPQGKWMWRCHIDLTEAQPEAWDFLRPYLELYDAAIFTLSTYVKDDLGVRHVAIVPPSIDPLSPKNAHLEPEAVSDIVCRYGVDDERPILCQVSRFDPWKDPLGVIDVYRLVKQQIPELQLVMIASMAADDPEGWSYYERTARRAGEDFDVHILSNLNGVGNMEVNAFQRAATVVIQKSLREGFGLVVAEALWKGRPVVAGNVGGIPLQILDGKTGYLATTTQEYADRVLHLMQNPAEAESLGAAGREHVRQCFLSTRNLRDYLRLFTDLAADK